MPATPVLLANIYSAYDSGFFPSAGGVHHEDLADIVTILDSFQTPLFSSAPKIRAKDVVHSWTVDTLTPLTGVASASSFAVAEGIDFSGDALTGPSRLMNMCQVFSRHVGVSDRERAGNPAGIRDMYEHQVMKEFKNIARFAEMRLWNVSGSTTGSASGAEATASYSLMAGIRGFAISSSGSASGSVTTADIVTLSQTLFENGAEPDSIWFAPASKKQFVNATVSSGSGNVRNIAATDQKLVANVDVFETPFNQLYAVITDRFIPMSAYSASGCGYYIGDRSMAKIAFYRPPQHKPMGKGGDHTRGIVLMDCTLELAHPSSWAVFTGVTG
jgi:hypothetical protein